MVGTDLTWCFLICPVLTYRVWSCTDLMWLVLNCHVLIYPNLSQPVLNCPYLTDLLWPVLTCPYLPWPFLTCPDLSCPDLTCPDPSWPDWSWPVPTCPELSWLVLTCPILIRAKCLFVCLSVCLFVCLWNSSLLRCLGKGSKKKIVEFSTKDRTPPTLSGKKRKMFYMSWNEFCMMWVIWQLQNGSSRVL